MKTVYIQRTTEDEDEDMEVVKTEVDLFVDGRGDGAGLMELARMWNV